MMRTRFRLILFLVLGVLVGCVPTNTPPSTATALPTETPPPTPPPTYTPRPLATATPEVATIVIDPVVEYQTMDGIGANSYAFPYANDVGWDWEAVRFVFDELDIAYIRLAPWLGWWETANDNDTETAYKVAGDPAQVNGADGIALTLPPLSMVNVVLSK